MNITVMGAGAWGTALAISLAGQHRVTLWARDAAQVAAMRASRCNVRYLPDVLLPDSLQLSDDFAASLAGAELVILSAPTAALRESLLRLVRADLACGVIWLCKGFEPETSLLPHQVAEKILPPGTPYGVLSGPSFALEVAQGLPTALVLASDDESFSQRTAQALHHSRLRVYASRDVVGVEVGGAVKNVMAIAAGVCDGMRLGNNARAALMTRGLAEISRLGLKLGGCSETLSGLSGAGDLILTCTGDLSRNRRVGLMLAQGKTLDEILQQLGHVAEGVYAAREVYSLAARLSVDMPISAAVYHVLYDHVPVAQMVASLLNRTASLEFSQ
ncbi:NAD(P)H-dependent glycerol-3-phosphate dehydrogenase [Gallionella capsiferriformans]|jgi:glycerol-3-phosphate dehydrogenase (NAD(P)+)|uniref:Glycerol-3-phosphate dehydrogenase [NAD(P)+] n=1 Tax=Gallionella capsiferriformans (strain ES-2) TaxID=395494 RepID=D9SIZ3_GALCS|nr:NAD(P)H-dependent glycerol-3-phosphate dehydrogenase [Gallionella capsiferriformans]ADL54269.1 NAD-dependent glycerol-3-phosphate dehydrogenase domain protein [Gallionella capsiferriformans ES-2]